MAKKTPAKKNKVPPAVKKKALAPGKALKPALDQEPAPDPDPTITFPIVGVGASAGGLEAFTQLLEALPAATGMAFVFVQHLDPTHESLLTEILSRATVMPVTEVKAGMRLERDRVYVIPPNSTMILSRGVLKLTPRPAARVPHMPIDHFFYSLAEDQGGMAIGVILSGSASDGVLGLKAIKAEGGITFAQDEMSARYTGMPRSAAAAGCVDFVRSPDRIAKELAVLGSHPYVSPNKIPDSPQLVPDGDEYGDVIRIVAKVTGVNFAHYKQPTLQRRIARRMALKKVESLRRYVRLLRDDSQEVSELGQDFLINVTSFFRDPKFFEVLKRRVIPRLLKDRPSGASLRIWVPGCSTGEEVYSIAMCLLEQAGDRAPEMAVQIFGTDITESAIEKARTGVYPHAVVADVSPDRLRRFFVQTDGSYQINKMVRDMCVFARQDVTKDPPFSNMDLISCRNLMIYLGPVLQKKVISFFHYSLKPGGVLVMGSSESLSSFSEFFVPVVKKERIFAKKAPARAPSVIFLNEPAAPGFSPLPEQHAGNWPEGDLKSRADDLTLARYGPPGVVVDENLRIVQFRGHTSPYMEPKPGKASLHLLKMVREGLATELRSAVQKAGKADALVRREHVPFKQDSAVRHVNLDVVPIRIQGSKEKFFLVLFEEARPAAAAEKRQPPSSKRDEPAEMRNLKRELDATREYLHSVIEAQETTNAELRSAYEEIQSSNEELQSTNEELETAKEELQSANEELTTVNDVLQNRNVELGRLNSDLGNLLSSVSLGIIMLDNEFRIRRFTPPAEKVMNLIPTDVGRRISDLRPNIDVPDLEALLLDTVTNLRIQERDVTDHDGRRYSLRIRPYRTVDNRIEGAVLLLVDVDELMGMVDRMQSSRDYSEAIVESVRQPLLVLDAQLRIQKANELFYETFLVTPEMAGKRLISDLGPQWDIPSLRSLLEEVAASGKGFEDLEVRIGVGNQTKTLLLYGRRFGRASSGFWILLGMEDVTARHEAAEIRYRRLFETAKDGVVLVAEDSRIIAANPFLLNLLSCSSSELLGRPLLDLFDPEDHASCGRALEGLRLREYVRAEGVRIRAKDGQLIETDMVCNTYSEGGRKMIQCNVRDIREQRLSEQQLRASLREKDMLLKEVHHRVKNNLQIIHSLLNIQAKQIQDPKTLSLYKESQGRIRSMALIHEELYRSKNLSVIDFAAYVQKLAASLSRSYDVGSKKIQIRTEMGQLPLNIETAIPCGMIIHELVSNALKHAFPGSRAGEVLIGMQLRDNDTYELVVADNGVGLPKTLDFAKADTLGLELVKMLAEQLEAALQVETAGGTRFHLAFKEIFAPSRLG